MLLYNEVECHKIISHENIIKTLDLCKTVNNIYIVCEFCESGDLYTYIKNKGKISEEEALYILTQIARAVNHIHCKGILHRDIKSANILLRGGNHIKLADFGFAEFIGYDFAKGMYSVGSPIYMSPEAFVDSDNSFKSDCWSIGIILYEMLIGQQPFNGIEFETFLYLFMSGEVYRPVAYASPFMKMLLTKMLDMNPMRRIDTHELLYLISQKSVYDQIPPQIGMGGPQIPGRPMQMPAIGMGPQQLALPYAPQTQPYKRRNDAVLDPYALLPLNRAPDRPRQIPAMRNAPFF
jgi:serine/threonine protein kinase